MEPMRTELDDLIRGMCQNLGLCDSSDPLSDQAHRTARKVDDVSWIPELITAYYGEEDEIRRRMIVQLIGTIGKRSKNADCLIALLTILRTEKSRYVLAEALHGLRMMPKPIDTDLEPIFDRLADRPGMTRQGAILALERCQSPEAERRILMHLASTPYQQDRFFCVAVLMSIGTEAALPALHDALTSKRKDIRFAASEAIALIADRKTQSKL